MSEPRISDEHGSVEQRLEEMKREVDALQVHVMREKAPWWKQVPVVVTLLVSLAALAFSFWSFQRGESRFDRQQEHEAGRARTDGRFDAGSGPTLANRFAELLPMLLRVGTVISEPVR